MSRVLAIGDVHGCTVPLDGLLTALAPTPDDTIIFLGDLVDRGPDTKGTIDRVIALRKTHRVICLLGNHEIMMRSARNHAGEHKLWLQVGGAETLASYSPTPGRMAKLTDVPEEHWDMLENDYVDSFETDQAVFVHATLNPSLPLIGQNPDALFWNKLEGPIVWPDGRPIVCGHTAQKSGRVLDLGSTICLDTYAYGGGPLTCLDLTSMTLWQANLLGKVTRTPLRGL